MTQQQGDSNINGREIGVYKKLSSHGIRLFNLTINEETETFLHTEKTVNQWRDDVRTIIQDFVVDGDSDSEEMIRATICGKLNLLGYLYINELVSDVYEGSIRISDAKIKDEIDHEGQIDGFGHYGLGNIGIDED